MEKTKPIGDRMPSYGLSLTDARCLSGVLARLLHCFLIAPAAFVACLGCRMLHPDDSIFWSGG